MKIGHYNVLKIAGKTGRGLVLSDGETRYCCRCRKFPKTLIFPGTAQIGRSRKGSSQKTRRNYQRHKDTRRKKGKNSRKGNKTGRKKRRRERTPYPGSLYFQLRQGNPKSYYKKTPCGRRPVCKTQSKRR